VVQKDIPVDLVIALAEEQMKTQGQDDPKGIEDFKKLYADLKTRKMAMSYGVYSAKKELLASCVFLFSHHRAYYIIVGNAPAGKSTGASHTLIDGFIRDYAEQHITLDFEGSDIPGLAFFYSSFGAVHHTYPAIRLNRLPFYLRWMKK